MIGLYTMWFAVLVSGIGAVGTAAVFALRPNDGRLMLMRPLSLASIFAAIGSLTAGWATILEGAAGTHSWTATSVQNLLEGTAETLTPVFITFGFLAVAWLLVAIGMHRQDRASTN